MTQKMCTAYLVDEVESRTGMTKAQAKQTVATVVEVLGERLASGDASKSAGSASLTYANVRRGRRQARAHARR